MCWSYWIILMGAELIKIFNENNIDTKYIEILDKLFNYCKTKILF